MPRVLVHIKNETRTDAEGQTLAVKCVKYVEFYNNGMEIAPLPFADFTVIHASDGTVAVDWLMDDSGTLPTFFPDPNPPVISEVGVAPDINTLKAQAQQQRDQMLAMLAQQDLLIAGIDNIQG